MLENINWNFMDSQHKHLPSKLQILKIKFSHTKQITLTEKASVSCLFSDPSVPSDGTSSGRRTVLNLSQVEEQLFGYGTYWFLRLGDATGIHGPQTENKTSCREPISTKSLRCPLRQCKNKKLLTWTSTLFSYTEDLWGLFEHMLGTQRRLTILYCSVLKCHPIIWAARMCLSGHNSMAKCQAYASF